jgi:hypothetical protein
VLVRCEDHPSPRYLQYSVSPIGYPNTAAICGICDKPGMILLSEVEWKAYQSGQRIFNFASSNSLKLRAA